MHQFGIWGLARHCVGVVRAHVGTHGLDLLSLLARQRLQDRFRGGLGLLWIYVQDTGAVDGGEDGDVVVGSAKTFLVDARQRNGNRLASLKPSFDSPIQERLGRVVGESEKGSGGLDGTEHLQNFDGKGFEEEGETTVLSGSWRYDRLHAVLRTATSRQPGEHLVMNRTVSRCRQRRSSA